MQENAADTDGRCPTCGRLLIGDHYNGEVVCPACGVVVLSQVEDPGPEWKAIDPEDKAKRVRVGSPRTATLHDFGLSTEIGSGMKDSQGRYLDPQARNRFYNLQKWQRRVRTTSSERSLSGVLAKITEVSDVLNLPKNVLETAAQVYRTSARMKVARSKSIAGMTAASVYMACRKCGVGRSLKEVSRASRIDKRTVAKHYRLLVNEVEPEYIPPPPIWKYISKLVNVSKIDPKVERLALQLAKETLDSKISSGKAPAGLAAAHVYIASVLSGVHIPQREIAEIAEVTEVTIRNRCREILENYVIKQSLKRQI